jgi:hypothetical protein
MLKMTYHGNRQSSKGVGTMKLAEIRELYVAGDIESFTAVGSSRDGYTFEAHRANGRYEPLHTERGQLRKLRSLDAVESVLASIGASQVTVVYVPLSDPSEI